MQRAVGTISRGVRAPIIKKGDDLVQIVYDSVLEATKSDNYEFRDKDIICVTEAVVAKAQGNYATIDDIAEDVKNKFNADEIGVIFPILSRNRFSNCLKGIAKGVKKIYLMLSYPSDEVGNHLFDTDLITEKGINPYADVMNLDEYRKVFGRHVHTFTGVDYVDFYADLIRSYGTEVEIIFSNNPRTILNYTKNVLACDIHTRFKTKDILRLNGAEKIFGLDDILTESVNGSGYNKDFGLLGSNKSTETSVKLFPRDCDEFVLRLQKKFQDNTGKRIEVMVYGDGAFKDPVGKIWELADPVVSPAYTKGLIGTPNEVKLKYLADNNFANLSGEDLKKAISDFIRNKDEDLVGHMESQGTTPRRLTDLVGSLADLTSGSGDKGTPIIHIQGYFDNYTN